MKLLLASEFDVIFPKPKIRKLLVGYQKLLFIPTASYHDTDKDYFETRVENKFREIGIESRSLEITSKGFAEVKSAIDACDILYVGGGNTFYLLEQMKKCRFKEAMAGFFEKGGLYIGSSAGAIVACPDIKYADAMDDPNLARLKDYAGLNLIDLPILQHMDDLTFSKAALRISQDFKRQDIPVFELNNDQAIYSVNGRIDMIR